MKHKFYIIKENELKTLLIIKIKLKKNGDR